MPLEVIQPANSLSGMIRFKTSAVYEMIISLQTLTRSDRHREWLTEAHKALPPDFWEELSAVYDPMLHGIAFMELGADYPDDDNVPGFIAYVGAMDTATFLFYLLGRVLTREQVVESRLEPKKLKALLDKFGGKHYHSYLVDMSFENLLPSLPTLQKRLTALWTRYWDQFLSHHIETLHPHWITSIQDKERILARDGARALLELITGSAELPPPLPDDQPVAEITFIPIYLIASQVYKFFGYGNMTVLFDSERTETQFVQNRRAQDEVLNISKALGDMTRLKILRLIAQNDGHIHGKRIAGKLELSASAVSRQLAQLRDAGLIVEEPGDDQTVNYRLQKEVITSLPDKLLTFLYESHG